MNRNSLLGKKKNNKGTRLLLLLKYAYNKYVLFVVLMLLLVYPYLIPVFLGLPEAVVMDLLFAGLATIILFKVRSKNSLPSFIVFLLVIESFAWLFFYIYHYDSTYLTRIFFLYMTGIVIFLLVRSNSIYKFGFFYNGIIMFQSVLGAIAFVLIYMGLLQPLTIYEVGERYIYFYGITSSNTVIGNFVRIGGFFDEPGALAMWGVFALVINKLVFNNRKVELLLMISLLFTFSAAYFVLLPLYIVFFFLSESRKKFVISLFILLPILGGGYYLLKDNTDFLWLTTERFQNGEIRSERYTLSENAEKVFKDNTIMGAGGKFLETTSTEYLNDNPYEILAKDGVVGYFFSYLPLFALCFVFRRRKDVILGSLLLFICYQQRPFHINEMHFFMLFFYVMIVYYKYKGIYSEQVVLNKLSSSK